MSEKRSAELVKSKDAKRGEICKRGAAVTIAVEDTPEGPPSRHRSFGNLVADSSPCLTKQTRKLSRERMIARGGQSDDHITAKCSTREMFKRTFGQKSDTGGGGGTYTKK